VTDKLQKTIDTYDQAAVQLADYFQSIGTRVSDIEIAFDLIAGTKNPAVLEIGCADGRDAQEIVKRTNHYTGFDVSKELIKIAREKVPGAKFQVADARTYQYHGKLDIVFAFASLLHLDMDELINSLKNIHKNLNTEGILFISLKKADKYKSYLKRDQYGERLFYLYSPEEIKELIRGNFSIEYESKGFITGNNTQWFDIALKKI
jgi:trans-aconitate methyltransferase